VSYDVNKDGVKVAVLTFTKSAYRLGETVLGVVELNERQGRSRVLSVSLPPPDAARWQFWLITCIVVCDARISGNPPLANSVSR
jgi:hypothetical protein